MLNTVKFFTCHGVLQRGQGDDMMTEKKDSCVKPSQGPILSKEKPIAAMNERVEKKEDIQMTARVGKPAIDFEARDRKSVV